MKTKMMIVMLASLMAVGCSSVVAPREVRAVKKPAAIPVVRVAAAERKVAEVGKRVAKVSKEAEKVRVIVKRIESITVEDLKAAAADAYENGMEAGSGLAARLRDTVAKLSEEMAEARSAQGVLEGEVVELSKERDELAEGIVKLGKEALVAEERLKAWDEAWDEQAAVVKAQNEEIVKAGEDVSELKDKAASGKVYRNLFFWAIGASFLLFVLPRLVRLF